MRLLRTFLFAPGNRPQMLQMGQSARPARPGTQCQAGKAVGISG